MQRKFTGGLHSEQGVDPIRLAGSLPEWDPSVMEANWRIDISEPSLPILLGTMCAIPMHCACSGHPTPALRVLTDFLATNGVDDIVDFDPKQANRYGMGLTYLLVVDDYFDFVGLVDSDFKVFVPSVCP